MNPTIKTLSYDAELNSINILNKEKINNLEVKSLSKTLSDDEKADTSKVLAKNSKEALYLLTDKVIRSQIMSGKDSVEKMLFPTVKSVLSDKNVSKKEKDDLVKRLRLDFLDCKVLIKNEYIDTYVTKGNEGIQYFELNVNKTLSPYKVL